MVTRPPSGTSKPTLSRAVTLPAAPSKRITRSTTEMAVAPRAADAAATPAAPGAAAGRGNRLRWFCLPGEGVVGGGSCDSGSHRPASSRVVVGTAAGECSSGLKSQLGGSFAGSVDFRAPCCNFGNVEIKCSVVRVSGQQFQRGDNPRRRIPARPATEEAAGRAHNPLPTRRRRLPVATVSPKNRPLAYPVTAPVHEVSKDAATRCPNASTRCGTSQSGSR